MSSIERQRLRKRTRNLFTGVIRKTLERPVKLTVSEWAEKYRILDESSNFQGNWSNDVTPYLVGIMDAFNDPYIQEINVVKPTQVGGTEAFINMIGWIICNDPAPTMIVYDTDGNAKDTSNDRLKPSLTKTPQIAERFYENHSKELNLKFRGMHLYLRGGGSPGKLASKAIKYLFFDEIDKLPGAGKKEASPYNLAKERTRTFTYSKKIYTCSTPTLKSNYVWAIHEAAEEQRNYFVPCPHCGEYIVFRFKQIMFPKWKDESKEEVLTNEERAKKAVYVCQECGCEITDRDKIKMLRSGEWRDVKNTHIGKAKKVSFWINALYSRFLTWSDIALEFLESKSDSEKMQNFANSWLAEPWEDTKLKTTEELVLERQTHVPQFIVPKWTKLLTGGVDVQENCLYWTIRAWGDFITSQNIAHGQAYNWDEIERIMNLEYEKEAGGTQIVNLALIDSGYDTDNVYDFCANNSDWSLPVKGASTKMQSHYKFSKVNKTGSKAYGMNLIIVDGGKYKDMIVSRMRRDNGRGTWMVYQGCDMEYAKQVTSEHKVSAKNGQKSELIWVKKTTHADNHYLDAEVYAMAAADMLGVRTLHLRDTRDEEADAEPETPEEKWINHNEKWIGE